MKKTILSLIIIGISLFFMYVETPLDVMAKDHDLNPVFSHEGGFYKEGFFLEINPKPHTKVYYTLDSSTPTTTSHLYTEPLWIDESWIVANGAEIEITADSIINGPLSMIKTSDKDWISPQSDIFKATVIKVVAIQDDQKKQSDILTNTYFVHPEMDHRYTFPIMSITTDASHLFDYHQGIHIPGVHYEANEDGSTKTNRTGNYFMRGDDWERPVHIQLFETSGMLAMNQNAGMRIHGGLSRKYPIKSYRLYARKEYDQQNTFDYPFFEDKEIDQFKRLILRNGGQAYQYTFMGEAFAQSLLKPLNLDIQYSTPIILFINGEYFGIRNVRDRFDTDYLKYHYGVDEKQSTILTGHAYMDDGSTWGQIHYQRLYTYATLSNLNNQKRFDQVERMMDIDNFIDYMIAEIYMGNVDWPQNNITYWRKNVSYNKNAPYGHDGRWRWMINDLDASFGISWGTVLPSVNSFERLTGDSWKTGKLFVNLLENDAFKARFIYRMLYLLDTIFESEHVSQELDVMIELYKPEMEEHIKRFGYPVSYQTWLAYVERMRNFALGRKAYLIEDMEAYLGIHQKHELRITYDETKGRLMIGDEMNQSGYHQGSYYDNLPITIKANPKEGYQFKGWYYQDLLISNNHTMILSPQRALDIEAHFEVEDVINLMIFFPWAEITVVFIITSINLAILLILVKKRRA